VLSCSAETAVGGGYRRDVSGQQAPFSIVHGSWLLQRLEARRAGLPAGRQCPRHPVDRPQFADGTRRTITVPGPAGISHQIITAYHGRLLLQSNIGPGGPSSLRARPNRISCGCSLPAERTSSVSPEISKPAPVPPSPGGCAPWPGSAATPSRRNFSTSHPRRMCDGRGWTTSPMLSAWPQGAGRAAGGGRARPARRVCAERSAELAVVLVVDDGG
jgi:hypothetical protein